MRYGLPYRGSKSTIAEWVVDVLPASHTLVDLFAGGCAVTHCALLSGKFDRVVANDLNGTPELFRECSGGGCNGMSSSVTCSEFNEAKYVDPALAILYSFGNNMYNYLWSKEIEPVKVAASEMLSAPSMHERRMAYRKFIKALSDYLIDGDHGLTGVQSLETLERLQPLERLERLQSVEFFERLSVVRADYRLVHVPDGATVYADIPYRGSSYNERYGNVFDHEAFEAWLAEVPFPVYVSESTQPSGCVEVASRAKIVTMTASSKRQYRAESIFVQERFYQQAVDNGA